MAAGETLSFACACGTLRGELRDVSPAGSTHVVCHCRDCRSAYTHLGRDDPGEVGILQTTQDRVAFTAGREHLGLFRHTPKGAMRWFARCCGSPLFHTPTGARLVHAGLNADRLDDPKAAGPVDAQAFVPKPGGGATHKGLARMVTRMASRIAAGNLSGGWRDSPFFDDAGAPVVAPQVLGKADRAAALSKLRR